MVGFLSNQVELELWFALDTGPPSANSFALEYVLGSRRRTLAPACPGRGRGPGGAAVRRGGAPPEMPATSSRIEKGDV